MAEAFNELWLALALAVALVHMILAAQFESLRTPSAAQLQGRWWLGRLARRQAAPARNAPVRAGWIPWLVAAAVAAGGWAGTARAQVSPATPREQGLLAWQVERRAVTFAVSTLPEDPGSAGSPSPGDRPAGSASQRYWLGTAVEGRMRPAAGGSRLMRGVLAFSASGPRLQPAGVSLGAAILQRRLAQVGALVASSAELWAQWDNQRDNPQGLLRLEGSLAAGRLGSAASAWYASEAFDPWPTWAGEVAAGAGFLDRFEARGSAGVSVVVRQALGHGRYWETRFGWQEASGPAVPHSDTPRLGYSLRFVMGRQDATSSVRTILGVRFRPSLAPGVIPQAGLGFSLRRRGQGGEAASVGVDVLADLGRLQAPGLSSEASYVPLAAAVSLELPMGAARLSLRSHFPASGRADVSSMAGWPGPVVLHLQVHPSDPKAAGRRLDVVAAYAAGQDRVSAGAAWVF